MMPMANAAVPLIFCVREKKRMVFVGPIRIVSPIRNRMLPIARRARSKKRKIPKRRKKRPVFWGWLGVGC